MTDYSVIKGPITKSAPNNGGVNTVKKTVVWGKNGTHPQSGVESHAFTRDEVHTSHRRPDFRNDMNADDAGKRVRAARDA